MNRIGTILTSVVLGAMVFTAGCEKSPTEPQPGGKTPARTGPVVVIETSMGVIKAELWADTAPITVKNFLAYTDAKHFDGLIFHRVKPGFMIQGGGFDPTMQEKSTLAEIKNEASADKVNLRGTLAMARTPMVDSATSQFFINLVDNAFLDHRDKTVRGFGYCAFGKVIEGMDVVDKIGVVPVTMVAGHEDVPVTPVMIKSVRREK
jgi:cyclophilin family peptidyl-prolyl cis-trans isomerase